MRKPIIVVMISISVLCHAVLSMYCIYIKAYEASMICLVNEKRKNDQAHCLDLIGEKGDPLGPGSMTFVYDGCMAWGF